jgi:hypothetical protein
LKIPVIAGAVLCVSLLVSSAIRGQAETAEQPKFQIEIQPAAEGGPRFTVKSLSNKTLTACTIRFSVSSEDGSQSGMNWDPIVQGGGDPGRERQQPLEPGASMTMFLPHKVGGPPSRQGRDHCRRLG